MVNRRTNKGQVIDLDSIMAQQKDIPAMGNMGVDAEGNTLGPGGEIVEGRDQRVRAYYKDNPQSSTAQQSLKGAPPKVEGSVDKSAPEVKTAKTAKENVRTQKVKPDPVKQPEPEAPDPEPEAAAVAAPEPAFWRASAACSAFVFFPESFAQAL